MVKVMCADKSDPRKARRYALLLGEGEKYPRLMARYKETVVEPRREAMRAVIRRGIARPASCVPTPTSRSPCSR